MKRSHSIIFVCACMLVAASSLAGADQRQIKWNGDPASIRPDFTVSCVFNGVLSGDVLIGDDTVEITPQTTICRVGVGTVDVGELVSSSSVLVSGYQRGDKLIATFVVIAKPNTGIDFSEQTVASPVLKPGTPR